MALLRVFEVEKWFKEWSGTRPNLELLLRCFDIDRRNPAHPTEPISVFQASSATEELESVAAHFETFAGKRAQAQYAVRIERQDCRRAGINVQHSEEEGATGIDFVDARHFNLLGCQDQFIRLVIEIVARLWEGQDRLRAFPAHQIAGQLAIFLALAEEIAEPEAKERCRRTLNKSPDLCSYSPGSEQVRIEGGLADGNQLIPVVAIRSVPSQSWWHRTLDVLLRRVKRL